MSDPRYPVGQFQMTNEKLSDDERAQFIAILADAPARLRAAVAGLDEAQLATPYREGGWTLRQTVHHVADSHMNGYIRVKFALTSTSRPDAVNDRMAVGSGVIDAFGATFAAPLGLANQGLDHSTGTGSLQASRGTLFDREVLSPSAPIGDGKRCASSGCFHTRNPFDTPHQLVVEPRGFGRLVLRIACFGQRNRQG